MSGETQQACAMARLELTRARVRLNCHHRFRLQHFCILLCLAASATRLHSQQKDCDKQIVTVAARDKHGQFVPGLQIADFRAKVRGKGADILSAGGASAVHRVVLVLDVGGSMAWKWRPLQRLSSEIIHSSPENTQFALIIFAGQALEKVEFGHSQQEILSAIDQFSAFPAKAERRVRDSLMDAKDLLQPAQSGDSVLVATDEMDNQSKGSSKTLERTFNSQGIRFFLLRFIDRNFQDQFVHNELELLSAATGGATIALHSPDDFDTAAQDMANEIAHYYLLQIALPEPLEKDSPLQLEIVNSSSRKRKDVELRFPQKLPACTAPSAHP